MEIKLLAEKDLTQNLQEQLSKLYLQLNSELKQLSLEEILYNEEYIDIAACFDDDKLVDIEMIANYKVVSGHKGMIEDVIVSENYRGQGIGRKLMEVVLQQAKKRKLDDVLLFSGHHRTAAISLYKSLGFTLNNSGLYIKKLD